MVKIFELCLTVVAVTTSFSNVSVFNFEQVIVYWPLYYMHFLRMVEQKQNRYQTKNEELWPSCSLYVVF